jgi:hypothetical protein
MIFQRMVNSSQVKTKKREAKLQRALVAMRTLQMASRAGSAKYSAEPHYQRRPAHGTMKNSGRPTGNSQLLIRSPLRFVAGCALLQNVYEMNA